jgi:hypothetical protein
MGNRDLEIFSARAQEARNVEVLVVNCVLLPVVQTSITAKRASPTGVTKRLSVEWWCKADFLIRVWAPMLLSKPATGFHKQTSTFGDLQHLLQTASTPFQE